MESLDFFSAFKRFSEKYDYTLSFSGPYTHPVVIDFCNSLHNFVDTVVSSENLLSKLVLSISIEMLQNIQFHAPVINKSVLGFFGIVIDTNSCRATTINYIYKKDLIELQKKIDYINSLSAEEINDEYHKQRNKSSLDVVNRTGCGLLDIRRKSSMNKFVLDFEEESEDLFLIDLSITINSVIDSKLFLI